MKFTKIFIADVYIIEPDLKKDERGFFYRVFDNIEFNEINKNIQFVQMNHSMNTNKGTLRGMHFQHPPFADAKLIRCTSGKIFDMIIDLRKNSSSFLKWFGIELSQENKKMLFIPEGFAHGFITLENNTEIMYYHTKNFHPEAEDGMRYNDPMIGIQLPLEVTNISERDKNFVLLNSNYEGLTL